MREFLKNKTINKKIFIGTAGWSYSGWMGNFYPEKLKSNEVLPYYATKFSSVEVNNSFYQIPKEATIKKWYEISPNNFIFSVKANRFITHMKKLHDTEESVERFLKVISNFQEKLGVILFQFPPSFSINLELFKSLLNNLPTALRFTFEFRHKSWFCEELYTSLRQKNMSLCLYDFKTFQPPEIITADFVYIRMHGPKKTPYQGSYEEANLQILSEKIKNWIKEGKDVYCYFDNDNKACAPKDAARLNFMVQQL